MKVKRALISVYDKTGLEDFVKGLDRLGVEMLSTGGTAKLIKSLGINVTEVSDYTGFPEMMDGRVKTLHPKIHAGLLAVRDNAEHMRQMKEQGIETIDMVVINLYPFEETISKEGVTLEEAIENIDIGGPTMLRSAAKNYQSVAVVSSPQQYEGVLKELESADGVSGDTLKALAAAVFGRTSRYDKLINQYLSGSEAVSGENFSENMNITLEKVSQLRYGENPHQEAAFYRETGASSIADAEQIQGKELSFNNILDLNVASSIAGEFEAPAVCIIKHNNPCGAATADTLKQAFLDALDCDRMSAFGGIMGFNGAIDGDMAQTILSEVDFFECIIAPDFSKEALEVFKAKKNLRVLKAPSVKPSAGKDMRKVSGGMLIQDADEKIISTGDLKTVTKKKPSGDLTASLMFGWKIAKYVKSNAIVLCLGTKTVGIGAGQMSRVDSVIIALRKAGEKAKGSVLISDAFFPKADSIEQAHKAEISAIIQPGGSIRDEEVIAACDQYGIPMVFTGFRHFRH